MTLTPLVWLLACSTGPGAPPAPAPDGVFPETQLERTGAGPVWALHVEPTLSRGAFALADSSLPPGWDADQVLDVDLSKHAGGRQLVVPFPFTLDDVARRNIASDLEISVDGQPLRYGGFGGGHGTWRLRRGDLLLNASGSSARLVYRGAQRLLGRRVLSRSGLSPAAFVRHAVTLSGETRNGLLLTTPSTATWSIDVPASGATFATTLSLDPPSRDGQASDGLTAVIRVGGEEVARHLLTQPEFVPVKVDLGRWAGKTVDVQLATEAHGTPDHDYAFFGSPTVWGAPSDPNAVRRVIVIGLDTTRPDHFGWYGYARNTTPELDAFANQSAVFVDAWTPAPRTRPSFRSATTGRHPLQAVGAKNLGEVFSENGFATAGIVANIHLQPRFDFDDGFDRWDFDGERRAGDQVTLALDWLGEHADRDAYLFLHIMDPHLPYNPPGDFRTMFVADPDPDLKPLFNRQQVKNWTRRGTLTPQRAEHIRGLYDGELRYTSQELGRFFRAVDAMPGQTLIVVHSDHGEELWEHGDFEHNHTLFDEVTRAVLWVRPPGGTRGGPVRVKRPATLADIGPTLYDFVGFRDLPPLDGESLRPATARPTDAGTRPIGLGHIQYGVERWGVVLDGHKYVVHTGTGQEELYALASDPGEQRDLAASTDLTRWRESLGVAHPELVAGPGWRLQVASAPDRELTLDLPAPAVAAGVLDPEALRPDRANTAWGETPARTPEDVGEVRLSEDRRALTFRAGPEADGMLWVLFSEPVPADDAKLRWDGVEATLSRGRDGAASHVGASGHRLAIRPGFVVVPPPDEAARMARVDAPTEAPDDDETCRLCVLGYKHGPECEPCAGEDP